MTEPWAGATTSGAAATTTADAPHLGVAVAADDERTTITLTGELDIGSGPSFERAVTAAVDRGRPLVLDLRPLTFVDSTGLRYLIATRRACDDAELPLRVAGASERVRFLLGLVGLEDLVDAPAPADG